MSIYKGMDKEDVVCIFMTEYYSAIKRNEIRPSVATWVDSIETVRLNKSDREGEILYRCSLLTKWCLTLLRPHGVQPASLLCPWDFPGKNTGVDCHFLFQGIFLTQGLNL